MKKTVFGKSGDRDVINFLQATNISSVYESDAITYLVTALKSNFLWDKIHLLYPFIGGTAQTHKFNLKNPDLFQIVFDYGWVHSTNGALAAGGFGNTGFVPSDNIAVDDCGISAYVRNNNRTSDDYVFAGCEVFPTSIVLCSFSSTGTYWGLNDTIFPYVNIPAEVSIAGLITQNRTGVIAGAYWLKGQKIFQTNSYAMYVPNVPMTLGGNNKNGTVIQRSEYQFAFFSMQKGFTDLEMQVFNLIIQEYQTQLNRQV